MNSPIEQVWNAWTTSSEVIRFFASEAGIDLTLGGPHELYFDLEAPEGSKGSEGCRVLSFLPMRFSGSR